MNKTATEDIDDHYVKSINRTWEQEERDFRHEDPSQISEEDFDKNLLKIMITGIYDIFYEPINEAKLRKDMMNESIVKTDIEYLTYLRKKSIEDLENPRKYLGKLKKEKND
ncbi:MAG TPA: hypothetical protein DHM90_14150 [Clostridiaceae bacterium]|nr:hypothetical protein [Clostridiaceae bacterium]